MPTKNEIIGNVYKTFLGSRARTLDRIKSDDKKKIDAEGKKQEANKEYKPDFSGVSGITKRT